MPSLSGVLRYGESTVKTAILGGSFNPVHNGHLALAEDVLKLGYERVLFIPVARSPFKGRIGAASDEERLAMLDLALNKKEKMEIWDGEIRRGGASYSIDTVKELIRSGVINSRPGLVIGDDLAQGFTSWKNVGELVESVDIILARRLEESPGEFPFPCLRLENRLWPLSSTQIREKIARREDLSGFLPVEVADFIRRKDLYADEAS